MKDQDMSATPLKPCQCPICTFCRRRKAIDANPSIEAYKSLLLDVTDHWLNESFDADYEIMKLTFQVNRFELALKNLRKKCHGRSTGKRYIDKVITKPYDGGRRNVLSGEVVSTGPSNPNPNSLGEGSQEGGTP